MEENWWRELDDLDDDQKAVIALSLDGSYLVKGPPGCGKTNLLLLRANYFVNSSRPNIALVVFNRTLKEFICFGANRYDFEPKDVMTSASLFASLLGEARVRAQDTGDFVKDRAYRAAALMEATRNKNPIYDAIFLDEAQDYLPTEIAVFRKLCTHLFMVADSRQQIYPDGGVDMLEDVVDQAVLLRFHYRTGRSICELADRVGAKFSAGYDPMLPGCNYNETTQPTKIDVVQGSLDQQIAIVAGKIRDQIRAYPKSVIGVIAPRLEEVKLIAQGLQQHGFGDKLCTQIKEDGYQPVDANCPIWVSTIHSAKGLEFRALHMLGMEKVRSFGSQQKRLTFTALTRAKTSLTIYHDKALPPYLAGALAEMNPVMAPQPLEAAFGKK